MRKLLLSTAATLAICGPAAAAEMAAIKIECENKPGCFVLAIEGDIVQGDDAKFEKLIKDNDVKLATVGLNSLGGEVRPAYGIGRIILDKKYTTYVPKWATCVSSCAMIWMAGSVRQVQVDAKIGFHGAFTSDGRGNVSGGASAANALVGSFYARLGLSDATIVYLTEANPNEMRWLSGDIARKYDIKLYVSKDKEAYVVGPWDNNAAEPETPPPMAPLSPPKSDLAKTKNFCVAVIEAPDEVKQDPEFTPGRWLTVREGPGREFKAVSRTGTSGRMEADETRDEWTHLVGRGWVLSKYVQPCDGRAATTINGHIQPPGLEPGGGGTIARCVPGYITRDPSCASTSASPKARRARR
jgi:hypothetical protein